MAKHLSVLRRFTISTVQYDGGIELEHHWRDCDWTGWVDDPSLPAVMRQATAHAKVCDGKPQPRRPSPPSVPGSAMMTLWDPVIRASLERHIVTALRHHAAVRHRNPEPVTGLDSSRIPAEVTAVEGCDCGGATMHRTRCTIWALPPEQRDAAVAGSQARIGKHLAALNAELRRQEANTEASNDR